MFVYKHLVQFYETDLMGIVHHSNYLRFCEEARVAWAHVQGLLDYQKPGSAAHFAVVQTEVKHLKPLFFGDQVEVELQARLQGARLIFEYKIYSRHIDNRQHGQDPVCVARTMHVPLDLNLKLQRPSAQMKNILEKETWIETWLLNL
jgi:acyl-CoA thioester hydrolase